MSAVGRTVTGVITVAGGVWLLVNTALYREAEAWSAAKVVAAAVGTPTSLRSGSATFLLTARNDGLVGLRIDQLCSTASIAGLMLIVTGGLLLGARVRILRALLALAVMVGVVSIVNLARITVLSWSVTRWGLDGWFAWLHLYGGAGISMVAIAVGCGLYLILIRPSPAALAPR